MSLCSMSPVRCDIYLMVFTCVLCGTVTLATAASVRGIVFPAVCRCLSAGDGAAEELSFTFRHNFIPLSFFFLTWVRWVLAGCKLVLGGVSVATFSRLAASEVTSQLRCWPLPRRLVRTTSWQQNKGFSQQLSHMKNHVSLSPELLCCTRTAHIAHYQRLY